MIVPPRYKTQGDLSTGFPSTTINVSLELINNKLLVLANIEFILHIRNGNFKEIIFDIKRHFFRHHYDKYKLFGRNQYSGHKFTTFEIISCNNLPVLNLSAQLPEGHCNINVRSKAVEPRSLRESEQNSFKAKFQGIFEKNQLIRIKKSINFKNRQNNFKKIKKKFGNNFSHDIFYKNKVIKRQILNNNKCKHKKIL